MDVIIAATDFSKPGNNAVEYAAHLARFFSAKLILVNAFKLPLGGYNALSPLNDIAELRQYGEENLSQLKAQLIKRSYDFGIETHVGFGTAFDVISEAAKNYSADLVVMGITGMGGRLKQTVIGSSTLQAARDLNISLAIISEQVNYKPIKKISLAAEMDNLDEDTLLYSARDITQKFGAELEIVTVEKPLEGTLLEKTANYAFVESRLKGIRHEQVTLSEDDVASTLEYYFKFHETDLVMVKPKKHKVFEKLFSGSITKHLAFHIRVPLLVLH
jgi:nucleotide-binding universal stress UspA family protein